MTNDELRHDLLSSFLAFVRTFYRIRTGREFELSFPPSRESHFITIARDLTDVFYMRTQNQGIAIPPRYAKAIDISTPILTRNGWSTAENIKVGDEIVGSKGWTKVLGVYPQGIVNAKEVIFSDGQSIVCNDDHLWNVCDRYTPTYKTLKTSQIESSLYEADGRKHWRIPLIDGQYGEERPFFDPYLFGCWLGDGHSHYAALTSMDEDVVQAFRDGGHTMRLHTHQSAGKAKTYGIVDNGFNKLLRERGLLKNKHIPEVVFRWSFKDRLSLLQGLMDTDGTCGKNGQLSFTNANKNIIKGVGYLVNSLGGIYRVNMHKCGAKRLNIRLPDGVNAFRLTRKQTRVSAGIKCSPRRFIANIIDTAPREMVCFTVDAEDKLFAVGEGLILTHNTEMVIHFVAWAFAHYGDCNFIYTSYNHTLASKQTHTVRSIIELPLYKKLFGLEISKESSAKDKFMTSKGGSVAAAGARGTITGKGAGIRGVRDRYGGGLIMDDMHKPDESTSDTIREGVIDWYSNTAMSRLNEPAYTSQIMIGQATHEHDLGMVLRHRDNWKWRIIPALDVHNNPLNPQMHTREMLLKMKEENPYVFAAQYMQDPQPAGGGLFKPDWFYLTDEDPEMLATFITSDTAETEKEYNDATVFSFWGVYKIKDAAIASDQWALHWIDCRELRVEPKDLEAEFMQFYNDCNLYKIKPSYGAIEKKSTGTTMLSILSKYRGMQLIPIERKSHTKDMPAGMLNNKINRFLMMQPYIAKKLVSLPRYGKHTHMCIEHMRKITANNSHRYDDIADTAYDAVKIALIDRQFMNLIQPDNSDKMLDVYAQQLNKTQRLKHNSYGQNF